MSSEMGCLNSTFSQVGKTVPDVPENLTVVHTAYPVKDPNGTSSLIGSLTTSGRLKGPGQAQQIVSADAVTLEDTSTGALTTKKVMRYKAKFDPRVTAKYDIKALIGRGGHSRVVRVEHKITKQPYAIKMVDRTRGLDMCEAELSVLRRVRHVNIIQLIEVFEGVDKLYMVVELATGGELFERIVAKVTFTEHEAVHVLKMLLDGAGYLHSLGIAHRDLKPENILYYHPGADSKILITDFGLSAMRKTGGDAFMATVCGTPEYIAPEVLARLPYTTQVDMWAIGVITYILLSGMMPFDDENHTRLYRQILRANHTFEGEPWKYVSSLARDFINKLLVTDAAVRLTAVQALKHQWITTMSSTSMGSRTRTPGSNHMNEQSTRSSDKSTRSSAHSTRSSAHSLRSEHRRVDPDEIDALHRDPEFRAELSSLSAVSASTSRG